MSQCQDVSVSEVISMFSHEFSGVIALDGSADPSINLDNYDQDHLLQLIDTLNGHHAINLYPYLKALLLGSQSTATSIASERRGRVVYSCIDNLKSGKIQGIERTQLVELILSSVRLLSVEHAQTCAERVLAGITRTSMSPDNTSAVSGHCAALELLPQLVARAGIRCKEYVIDKMCEMTWPAPAAVMLSAALVELCQTEADCRRAAAKISAHIHWGPSLGPGSQSALSGGEQRPYVSPEDLPGLVYQLTTISCKCGEGDLASAAPAAAVRALVVDEVADALDGLLDSSMVPQGGAGGGHGGSNGGGARVDTLLATIVHHLTLLVSKDQGISTEIIRRIKAHSLLQYLPRPLPRTGHAQGPRLSSARLLLGLLAARAGRIEAAALSGLTEAIAQSHSVLSGEGRSSLWFDRSLWRWAVRIRPEHLRGVFAEVMGGPLMGEAVATPLVKLAFLLLSQKRAQSGLGIHGNLGTPWSHLSGASVTCLPSPLCSEVQGRDEWGGSCASFGAWLVCYAFTRCVHARTQIARELVLRLHLAGASADGSASSSASSASIVHGQGEGERLLVDVLDQLASECPHGLLEVVSVLQDVFLALPSLHPVTAGEVVRVLGPLCVYTPTLSDRCALAMRKASFSKDVRSRQAAVSALSALLRSQLAASSQSYRGRGRPGAWSGGSLHSCSSQNDGSALSSRRLMASNGQRRYAAMSQQEQLSQRVSTGLSIDEVLSLCRRFLQHQAPVRAVLYDKLSGLDQDFPFFRPLLLRLAVTHLRGIVKEGDHSSAVGGGEEGLVLAEGSHGVLLLNLDRCVDASGCISEAVCDLLMFAMAIARNALEDGAVAMGDNAMLSQEAVSLEGSQSEGPPPSPPSSPRHDSDVGLREAADLCRYLWRLCRGLSVGDLADYALPPRLSSVGECRRMVVLVEAVQTAMVCVMAMPDSFGGITLQYSQRAELLAALEVRLEGLSDQVLLYRKKVREQEKERAKEKKAARGAGGRHGLTSGDGDMTMLGDGDATAGRSTVTSQLPLPHFAGDLQGLQARVVVGAEHLCTQGMELELHFLDEALSALNHSSADFEQETEQEEATLTAERQGSRVDAETLRRSALLREVVSEAKVSLQESVSAHFLRRHLLERSLRAVEGVLFHLEDIVRYYRSGQSNEHEQQTAERGNVMSPTTRRQHLERSVQSLMSGVRGLFCSLLKEMVRQRTEEREHHQTSNDQHPSGGLIFPGVGAAAFLTAKQVAVRALLGCVRAEALAGALRGGGRESRAERMRSMSAMLQLGFEKAHIKRTRRAAGGTQTGATGASALTGGTAGEVGDVPSLDYQAKSFVTLFLSMHGTGDRGGERAEAPLFVCLLGELAGIMSEESQERLRALVVKSCNEKLELPTPQLSTSLIQLLILRAAGNPKDRSRILSEVADMVEAASAAASSRSDDESSDGESAPGPSQRRRSRGRGVDETFTFLSVQTAGASSLSLIGIMDKFASEIDVLSRLVAKHRGAVVTSSTVIATPATSASYASGDSQRRALLLSFCDGEGVDVDEDEDSGSSTNMIDADSSLCQALHMCMQCAVKLLNLHSSTAVSLGVTSLLLKLYKIQVRLAKEVVSVVAKKLLPAASAISPAFREMSHHTTSVVNPSVQAYLTQIHNVLDHQVSVTSGGAVGKGARNKLSKSIPDLIFQMEQLDLCFIKLQSTLREKEKHIVSRWIKRSTARDFRLRTDLVELEQDKARSVAEEKHMRKMQAEQRRQDKRQGGGKRGGSAGSKKRTKVEAADDENGIAAEYYDNYDEMHDEEAEKRRRRDDSEGGERQEDAYCDYDEDGHND